MRMDNLLKENGLIIFIILASLTILLFFLAKKFSKKSLPQETVKPIDEKKIKELDKVKVELEKTPKISWTDRLSLGLEKSRQEVWGKIGQIFSSETPSLDEIEEVLYTADIPTNMVQELLDKLEKEARGKTQKEIQELVYLFLKNKMESVQMADSMKPISSDNTAKKTKVFMIVGVNGAGKTTTIGKLATKLKSHGNKVIVGACDTFRAAAVDQLQVWCDRAGVDMVRAKDGADPSGVAYDAAAKAFAGDYDYCLIDTAGRLHTNQNLMEELIKTKRVMGKVQSEAPHEVFLVLDAITGQNALRQAQEFHKALGLTGLIFTKCDGSAKAGSAVGIVDQLKVPIKFIGVGEQVEDLESFDLDLYLKSLVGIP